MHLADFIKDAEGARGTINAWAADQTSDKITNLLPPKSLDTMTRLVLVDTIYFKANWASGFDARQTTPAPFAKAGGASEQVPTMGQTGTFEYASGSGWQAVELPYYGYEVAMDVVLPASGTELDAAAFGSMIGAMQPTLVQLSLPKFRVAPTESTRLRSPLQALGMNTAFVPNQADFSGITPAESLYVSDVFHQAFLDVDEHGTEAAAATGVVLDADASAFEEDAAPPVIMTVDRPFFIAIRDQTTGTILFAGKIVDPLATP